MCQECVDMSQAKQGSSRAGVRGIGTVRGRGNSMPDGGIGMVTEVLEATVTAALTARRKTGLQNLIEPTGPAA